MLAVIPIFFTLHPRDKATKAGLTAPLFFPSPMFEGIDLLEKPSRQNERLKRPLVSPAFHHAPERTSIVDKNSFSCRSNCTPFGPLKTSTAKPIIPATRRVCTDFLPGEGGPSSRLVRRAPPAYRIPAERSVSVARKTAFHTQRFHRELELFDGESRSLLSKPIPFPSPPQPKPTKRRARGGICWKTRQTLAKRPAIKKRHPAAPDDTKHESTLASSFL